MSYKLKSLPPFDRQAKRLSKKYGSLKADLRALFQSLEKQPIQGRALGKNCYKIRLAIGSKKQGKSGGARIVTCVRVTVETIFLLTIYDKSDKGDLEPNELNDLLQQLPD